jgi:hypothetical protein
MLTITRFIPFAALVAASAACSQSPPAPSGEKVLTQVSGNADYLTASGGYVYWARFDLGHTETWSIERVPEGGGSVERLAANVSPPGGLAVDGGNVYWTDSAGGRLLTMPVSAASSGAAPTVIASNLKNPSSVVVAGGAAYITEGTGLFEAALLRVPLDGSAQSTIASGMLLNLASDGTSVYFVQLTPSSDAVGASWDVYAYTSGHAPKDIFAPPLKIVDDIAPHGDHLYVLLGDSVSSPDDLVSVPLVGGASTTLASGVDAKILGITTESIYWSSTAGVWKMPTGGGTPTRLSSDTCVSALAGDGARLFAVGCDAGATAIVDESP